MVVDDHDVTIGIVIVAQDVYADCLADGGRGAVVHRSRRQRRGEVSAVIEAASRIAEISDHTDG